jgi:Zn-dependent oligopeptidase
MYCSFSHIFDWGYSAGYYSYTWADIIVSEILAVFKESWMYDKETATRFEKLILWAWSVKKASDMFKDFMWREISIEAFLKEKWL